MGLYRSATRPSVRCNPVSCRGYFHARRESQYHRKQSWQAGHECTHSCNTLVGNLTPNPIKEPPTAVFFIAPNAVSILLSSWSSLPYSAPARAHSRSTCGAFGKAAKRPLPGNWGASPTSGFSEKIASAYDCGLRGKSKKQVNC